MANLFETATAKTKTSAAKKEKLTLSVSDKDFDQALVDFVKAKQEVDSWKSKMTAAQGVVKEKSQELWLTEVETIKRNPGSVIVTSENASFQFVPMDKYLMIDDDRAKELKKKYGNGIVSTETTFSFNPELLAKYGQVLSDLITNCKDIDVADKGRLIEKTEKVSIAKGTLDDACTKSNVEEIIEDVQPQFQCKYPKLLK